MLTDHTFEGTEMEKKNESRMSKLDNPSRGRGSSTLLIQPPIGVIIGFKSSNEPTLSPSKRSKEKSLAAKTGFNMSGGYRITEMKIESTCAGCGELCEEINGEKRRKITNAD
jgi:hypothetical protein